MFEVGCLYKNSKNTDVAFCVLSASKCDDGYYLNVMWFNIVDPLKPYSMNLVTETKIQSNHIRDWNLYDLQAPIERLAG